MEGKSSEVLSKINTVTSKLRHRHSQSLYTALYYSLANLFHYWLQHCYPAEVLAASQRIDQALLHTASLCVHGQLLSDPFCTRRLRLPARMYGGGVRSLVELAPAAFVSTVCKALPTFLDRVVDGTEVPGFLPQLAPLLGQGSFDRGNEDARLTTFLTSGMHMATSFLVAWQHMQGEVGDTEGPLAQPVQAAGARQDKLQKAITRQRERVRFQHLNWTWICAHCLRTTFVDARGSTWTVSAPLGCRRGRTATRA